MGWSMCAAHTQHTTAAATPHGRSCRMSRSAVLVIHAFCTHFADGGSVNDFVPAARGATCQSCGVLNAVVSPSNGEPTRAVFETVLSARLLRSTMKPTLPMALFTNQAAHHLLAALLPSSSSLELWDLHRDLDPLMAPLEVKLIGENQAHGPSIGASAAKLVALMNTPFERTLFVDVDIWVLRPQFVWEMLAHKLQLSDIAMALDPNRAKATYYNAIVPPICTCLMAYRNATIVHEQMEAARAGLMRRAHRSVRQSDQEYMWFEWTRRPQLRLLVLPEEYYCPMQPAPVPSVPIEAALSGGFLLPPTYAPVWTTPLGQYRCHTVHTHMLDTTMLNRLRTNLSSGWKPTATAGAISSLGSTALPSAPPSMPPQDILSPTLANSSKVWQRELPRFESYTELCAEPLWMRYLDAVYGNELRFPIDLRAFHFFYFNYLHHRPPARPLLSTNIDVPFMGDPQHAIAAAGHAQSDRNLQRGRAHLDVYLMWGTCGAGISSGCGRATVWVYPFLANGSVSLPNGSVALHIDGGIPDNTRVEVYHCANGRDSASYWMYLAVGSGIFYDVGRSYRWLSAEVQKDSGGKHLSILKELLNRTVSSHERLPAYLQHRYQAFTLLRQQGYDSVQFPHTTEHNMWKFELVDLRPLDVSQQRVAGMQACPNGTAAAYFFSGWGGTERCVCQEEGHACLNCGGPDAGAGPSEGSVVRTELTQASRSRCMQAV